jgi:predicted N-acetyltransferase YhbS
MTDDIIIRSMTPDDLEAADRIHRLAFGTFFGLPEPSRFRTGAEVLRTRFVTDPATAWVAEQGGVIVGSAIGMDWGSVFVVGPITVHPEQWSKGIARRLMPPLLEAIAARPVTLAGLFTHPASTKHIRLYESYGFTTQPLTGVMSKAVTPMADAATLLRFSMLTPAEQAKALSACRAVTDGLYPGLDLSREIRAMAAQKLGETLLLESGGQIAGFALCHAGPGTEAGSGRVFVKFAAVRPDAAEDFARLVDGCEALAASLGAERIIAGVNSGRRKAYAALQARGYRSDLNGIAMHRPDLAGYNRPDLFVIDDWR